MQMSARILGDYYGLTSQEMNRALLKLGFYNGSPGDYIPTEKALPYVKTEHFHRGNGGYSHYNRYWSTITFDDSIMEQLNITAELIDEIKSEMAAERAIRNAARAAARAKADQDFLAMQAAKKAAEEMEALNEKQAKELLEKIISTGKVCIIVGGIALIGYGVYKTTPQIKKWWNEHTKESEQTNTGAA